jgi:hypothetical protein
VGRPIRLRILRFDGMRLIDTLQPAGTEAATLAAPAMQRAGSDEVIE